LPVEIGFKKKNALCISRAQFSEQLEQRPLRDNPGTNRYADALPEEESIKAAKATKTGISDQLSCSRR
jgi:hypothetical protein